MMPNRKGQNCPALNLPKSKRPLIWNENPEREDPEWPMTDEEIKARIWAIFEPYIQIAQERDKHERYGR